MLMLPAVASGKPQLNIIHHCDALTLLKALPDESVNCIVTSPPYFGLRDYGVDGQIGLEETPAAFIARLVEVFHEARRVLRSDGLCFINIGDSYANDDKWGGTTGGKHAAGLHGQTGIGRKRRSTGLPPKSLMMIPARLAIAMQDDGWTLRSEIVWSKPAPTPESVKDRPTKSHEMVYMFAKSSHYYYDLEATKEPAKHGHRSYSFTTPSKAARELSGKVHGNEANGKRLSYAKRNMRDVWVINAEPSKIKHYAMMPQKLAERCILAGCPAGGVVLDMFMGSGTTAVVSHRLERDYIGCDLNHADVIVARERLISVDSFRDTPLRDKHGNDLGIVQKSLFTAMVV